MSDRSNWFDRALLELRDQLMSGVFTWWLIFLMSMCIAGAYLGTFGLPSDPGRNDPPDQTSW